MQFKRRKNSYIGGVCGGLEDSTKIPAVLWRIGFIFIPSAIWIYLTLWAFTKEQ
jgi:phage shock protein PspC (stress-responsive transcriptional regulator)